MPSDAQPAETVAQLRDALNDAWSQLTAAITAAAPRWNDPLLDAEDPSDKPWTPRVSAWHAIVGERWRRFYLAELLDTRPKAPPTLMDFIRQDRFEVERQSLRAEFKDTTTPEAMLRATELAQGEFNAAIDALSDDDLDVHAALSGFQMQYLQARGETAQPTIRGALRHAAVHLRDHAQHVRSAS